MAKGKEECAMNGRSIYWSAVLLATSLFLSGSLSLSAESLPDETAGIVRDKNEQGISYMMGGVGIGEREMMESLARDYNVKLVFAEEIGVYLAFVDVTVQDRDGKQVFSGVTNGPWLYLNLPTGNYMVKAAFDNETKQINLHVASDGRVARLMHWDLAEEFPIYARMARMETRPK
jgi:hypothetical protein